MLDGNSIEKTMRDGVPEGSICNCGYCRWFMPLDLETVGICQKEFDRFEDAHRGTCRMYEAYLWFSGNVRHEDEECRNRCFEEA